MNDKAPLQWIRMELNPLFDQEEEMASALVFWHPQAGLLEGPDAERIRRMVQEAQQQGYVLNSRGERIEISDPLRNTVQFSAILSQVFWISPQPVASPEEPDAPAS